jgi:hypothetical protein
MSRITSRLVFAAIVVAFGAQSALAGATRGYHTSHGSFTLVRTFPDAALRARIRLPRPRTGECD